MENKEIVMFTITSKDQLDRDINVIIFSKILWAAGIRHSVENYNFYANELEEFRVYELLKALAAWRKQMWKTIKVPDKRALIM